MAGRVGPHGGGEQAYAAFGRVHVARVAGAPCQPDQGQRGDAVAAYEIMQETIERARAGAEDEELEFGAEYDALDDSDDDEESSDSPERDGYDDDPVTVEAEDVQEIEPEAGDMSGLRLLMGILIFILVLLVLGHVANML